jgi:hypothetical protein
MIKYEAVGVYSGIGLESEKSHKTAQSGFLLMPLDETSRPLVTPVVSVF